MFMRKATKRNYVSGVVVTEVLAIPRHPVAMLFDLGDTLITHTNSQADRNALLARSAVKLLEQYDCCVSANEFQKQYSTLWGEWRRSASDDCNEYRLLSFLEALLEQLAVPKSNRQTIARRIEAQAYQIDLAYVRPVDDASWTLDCLRSMKVRIGVVSNSAYSHAHIVSLLEKTELLPYVDVLVVSSDLLRAKPAVEPFAATLAKLSAEPGESMFVGNDFDIDVIGAIAAGFQAVFLIVHTGIAPPLQLPRSVTTIEHLSDILEAFC